MTIAGIIATVKHIKHITKTNGETITYLYVNRPATTNDVNTQIEPSKTFCIIVYPPKAYLLASVQVNDTVCITVWLNSKPYVTKRGWTNYVLSMHLSNLKRHTK